LCVCVFVYSQTPNSAYLQKHITLGYTYVHAK
jgi:hypothetical protein